MLRTFFRLAFICNLFFVLAVVLQLTNWLQQQDVTASIAIIGYFMAIIVNPLVNLTALLLFFLNKKAFARLPRWLLAANAVFLCLQIIYIIYLNDTQHH